MEAPRPRFSAWVRFPGILDRYVLGRFLRVLLLVTGSVLLLAVIVDYADHIDKIATNHPSAGVLLGYYRYFLLSIGVQIAPFVILLATLISLGIFSKSNEDTAFKTCGVSLYRLAAAVLVTAGIGGLMSLYGYYLGRSRWQEEKLHATISPSLLRCPFILGILTSKKA